MKISKFLLVLALSISAFSCSSDDDAANTDGAITGTWIAQDFSYTGTTTTMAQGQTLTANFVGEAYDIDYIMTLSENPNNLVANGSYSIELTTTVAGQTQVDTVENLEVFGDGTWSKSGNELTVMNNGETGVATITELTDTTLKIESIEEQDLSQQGISIVTRINIISTFTRQQ